MALLLGATPLDLQVNLNAGFDFISGLDSEDGDWPETATIALVFNDEDATTWTANIAAAAADWNVDKVEVDALIAALPRNPRVSLTYTDYPVELLWADGRVMR